MAEQDNRELVKALGEIAKALGGGQQMSGIITQLNALVQATNAEAQVIRSSFLFTNWVSPPALFNSPGTPGMAAYSVGFLYICVENAHWQRVAIANF